MTNLLLRALLLFISNKLLLFDKWDLQMLLKKRQQQQKEWERKTLS